MALWKMIFSEADDPKELKRIFITFYAMQYHFKNYMAVKDKKYKEKLKEQDTDEKKENRQNILTNVMLISAELNELTKKLDRQRKAAKDSSSRRTKTKYNKDATKTEIEKLGKLNKIAELVA